MEPLSTNALAHFLHSAHELNELNANTPYLCDGCKIVGMKGARYTCVSCKFDLHVYCAKCPTMLTPTTNHPHPMSLVVHKSKPNQTEPCRICCNLIEGLAYECKSCNFLVHPLCVSNQECVVPSELISQAIGEKIEVELKTDYIYETLTENVVEVLSADSNASEVDEVPSADTSEVDDESCSFPIMINSVIEYLISSLSACL